MLFLERDIDLIFANAARFGEAVDLDLDRRGENAGGVRAEIGEIGHSAEIHLADLVKDLLRGADRDVERLRDVLRGVAFGNVNSDDIFRIHGEGLRGNARDGYSHRCLGNAGHILGAVRRDDGVGGGEVRGEA